MYTLSKGTSKYVTKTRIGIPSHLENGWESTKKNLELSHHEELVDISKPVFVHFNNKEFYNKMRAQETSTPEHEEIVKFVSDSWSSVCEKKESLSMKNGSTPVYYSVKEDNQKLKDFVPFDLDSWWGKRIFNTITKSVS